MGRMEVQNLRGSAANHRDVSERERSCRQGLKEQSNDQDTAGNEKHGKKAAQCEDAVTQTGYMRSKKQQIKVDQKLLGKKNKSEPRHEGCEWILPMANRHALEAELAGTWVALWKPCLKGYDLQCFVENSYREAVPYAAMVQDTSTNSLAIKMKIGKFVTFFQNASFARYLQRNKPHFRNAAPKRRKNRRTQVYKWRDYPTRECGIVF